MDRATKEKRAIKKPRVVGEFKEFISRGNVMDLAVGVIIGGAFSKIVTSLVNDIIMPFIGFITGNVNVADLKIILRPAVANGPAALVFGYGAFIQTIIDFLLIALVIFFLVKGINAIRRKKKDSPAPPAAPPEDIRLLTEIRDLLKDKKEI